MFIRRITKEQLIEFGKLIGCDLHVYGITTDQRIHLNLTKIDTNISKKFFFGDFKCYTMEEEVDKNLTEIWRKYLVNILGDNYDTALHKVKVEGIDKNNVESLNFI